MGNVGSSEVGSYRETTAEELRVFDGQEVLLLSPVNTQITIVASCSSVRWSRGVHGEKLSQGCCKPFPVEG